MDMLAVLIPCYNEEITVGEVIRKYREAFPNAVIYVYDNMSTDKTVDVAISSNAIVRRCTQRGKGNVVRAMFREIEAECYLLVDGDNTYGVCKDLVDEVLSGADMVIGDRLSSSYFTENKRLFHSFGNKLVRFLINRLFKSNITDMMSGCRAFSRAFVKSYAALPEGFDIEVDMCIHAVANNMRVVEMPIDYRDRVDGSVSKLNTYRDGIRVLGTVLKLFKYYKPMVFFSWVSLAFFMVSLVLGIPVFNDYFSSGLVLRFPTLIFSGFMLMVSLVSLSTGLILDSLARKNRVDFEMYYRNFL